MRKNRFKIGITVILLFIIAINSSCSRSLCPGLGPAFTKHQRELLKR